MAPKVVCLLLCALILTQCSVSSEEIDDELPPRQQLFVFFIGGYSPISRMTSVRGVEIIKSMLEDTDADFKASSEELHVPVSKLTDFVQKVEKLKNSKDMPIEEVLPISTGLIGEFGDIVEKYNTTALDKPSLENFKLKLQKNGFEQLSKDFNEAFASFKPKFYVELDKYLAALSAEERTKEAKMIDWYAQFKSAPKLSNFVQFFGLYPADTIMKLEAHL